MKTKKEIVYKVTFDYLDDANPCLVNELEIVFDSIFESLERENVSEIKSSKELEGFHFDGGLADSALVSLVCYIALKLLNAAAKDFTKRDLPKLLDNAESELSNKLNRPDLIKAIRNRLEGILQSL